MLRLTHKWWKCIFFNLITCSRDFLRSWYMHRCFGRMDTKRSLCSERKDDVYHYQDSDVSISNKNMQCLTAPIQTQRKNVYMLRKTCWCLQIDIVTVLWIPIYSIHYLSYTYIYICNFSKKILRKFYSCINQFV